MPHSKPPISTAPQWGLLHYIAPLTSPTEATAKSSRGASLKDFFKIGSVLPQSEKPDGSEEGSYKRWRQPDHHAWKRKHAVNTVPKRKSASCGCICWREPPFQRSANEKGS